MPKAPPRTTVTVSIAHGEAARHGNRHNAVLSIRRGGGARKALMARRGSDGKLRAAARAAMPGPCSEILAAPKDEFRA